MVFLSCLSGVAGWCLRGIEGMIFFCWLACQYQLGVKGMNRDALLLGLYAGLMILYYIYTILYYTILYYIILYYRMG